MIIVAGAGSAGLTAALAASDRDLEVLLIEPDLRAYLSCNSARSTGMVMAGGTKIQQRSGVDDNWEWLLADILKKNRGRCAMSVVRALVKASAPMVDWLAESHGVNFSVVKEFKYPGHTQFHMHATPSRSGQELVDSLWRAVRSAPQITVLEGCKLTALDAGDGKITGARIQYPDGQHEDIATDTVILATNGFGNRKDWVRRYIPSMVEATYFGGPNSDGSGIEAALKLGAGVGFMSSYQGHATINTETGLLVTYSTVMTGGILINIVGSRFGDETAGYSEFAERVMRQPDQRAYLVFDQSTYDVAIGFRDFREIVAAGAVRSWETTQSLGGGLGLTASVWRETVDTVSRCKAGEIRDRFGRTNWGRAWRSPLYSVVVHGALLHTQGGLAVNDHAQVLREIDREPIIGLYAAGGAAQGISGDGADGYLSGNGLLSAMGLGFIAGNHAGN